MPIAYKILGQQNPGATTSTDLYTVPASTSAVVSTVNVCNLSAVVVTFRLSTAIAGAAIANVQYLAFDQSLAANQSISFTLGITLAATDKLRCFASTANVTFQAFGMERS